MTMILMLLDICFVQFLMFLGLVPVWFDFISGDFIVLVLLLVSFIVCALRRTEEKE